MYITKYSCVFLKFGKSIYMAMDLIPILLGSIPLAHNAQHSLVIGRAGAGLPSRIYNWTALSVCMYPFCVPDTVKIFLNETPQ